MTYTCPQCGRASQLPGDLANRHCGVCGSEEIRALQAELSRAPSFAALRDGLGVVAAERLTRQWQTLHSGRLGAPFQTGRTKT
jgi:hypothetical protein